MTQSTWACYYLASTTKPRSYIGATVDPARRLRQHNGEIKGGARYTRGGRPWRRVCYVDGFQNQRQALQFEWRWKHMSSSGGRVSRLKKYNREREDIGVRGHASMKRRINALIKLLHLERYTSNAPIAKTIPLTIHWEWGGDQSDILSTCCPPHIAVVQ